MTLIRYLKPLNCILFCWISLVLRPPVAQTMLFPFADTTGAYMVRSGHGDTALQMIIADTLPSAFASDSAFGLFKKGVASYIGNNDEKALAWLRQAAEKSSALEPFAYEMLGDIQARIGNNENALQAYRVAQQSLTLDKYQRRIKDKMYAVVKKDTALAAEATWFTQQKNSSVAREDWVVDFLDTVISRHQWDLLDSIIEAVAATGKSVQAGRIVERCALLPDSVVRTQRVYDLAVMAYNSANYENAQQWLDRCEHRSDFLKAVPQREFLYYRGYIAYRQRQFMSATAWFDKYESRYALLPEMILALGRAYREIGKPSKSALWYDKFIKLYPNDPKGVDILWVRARQEEELKNFNLARHFFLRLTQRYSKNDLVDDAFFRRGFCFYKEGKFDSAGVRLGEFARKQSASSLVPAALYWQARSLSAQGNHALACSTFAACAKSNPIDYYAFAARGKLQELGADSLSHLVLDTVYSIERVRFWLDSMSLAQQPLSSSDSQQLSRATWCALAGLTLPAEQLYEGLCAKNNRNVRIIYDAALAYLYVNQEPLAHRLFRKNLTRIPATARGTMPLALWEILFPFPWRETIIREANAKIIDPLLVCSIMRQESVFDSAIMSPAGAVGLLQLMPATGRTVAKKLNRTFSTDSLTNASFNIALGTAYIKELLDQWNDNLPLTIASYNAGPDNARRWKERFGIHESDLFIENIGFNETRDYVKKVLANYWMYGMLAYPLGYQTSKIALQTK